MPLLAGDIRFARSAVMADVPEGGGPPSAQLLTSGRSNEIFPDISEETRTTGRVEIYQIFSLLRNTDNAPLLGANVILAEPPADPNVSITLLSLKNPFATRHEIARRIESGMAAGSEWGGYLLENHFETMRSIQLLQRPGMSPPTLGKTYVLVVNEGLSSERRQRVRIKTAETQQRIYTEIVNNVLTDFAAQVTTCELFDSLSHDFPGSVPRRSFARQDGKTVVRETVYSDSGLFCSASRLTAATQINDVWLQTASVYTQIVPNSRTEAALVDQRPSARQTMVLATSPRRIEVGITPHTQRIKIAEENASQIFVAQLRPLPAPGTLFIDFWALGQRYTIYDDGTGRLTGAGGGAVSYLTGAMSFTLKNPPDIGSSICITHGEKSAYRDRSGQAGYRSPEFAWQIADTVFNPGSVVVKWPSGGVLKTATDNGSGGFTGNAAGEINYANATIYLRPAAMIDAGGEFKTDYILRTQVTEQFPNIIPDAGGFALINLADAPVPKTLTARWVTTRTVSQSSGSTEMVTKNSGADSSTTTVTTIPQATNYGLFVNDALPSSVTIATQDPMQFKLRVDLAHAGEYRWFLKSMYADGFGSTSLQSDLAQLLSDGATGGDFTVSVVGGSALGYFNLQVSEALASAIVQMTVKVKNKANDVVVGYAFLSTFQTAPSAPPPADTIRTNDGVQAVPGMRPGGRPWNDGNSMVQVVCEPLYDPKYGWVYNPPSEHYFGAAQMQWSQAELGAGEKSLLSWAGPQVTYKIWTGSN